MSLNLIYPNAVTQREIAQDLIRNMTSDDLTLKLLPVQNEDTHFVRWFQMDNYYGIMGMRGLDGSPSLVREVGTSSYTYQPGVYGEFMQIGETEILTRAAPMNMNLPIRLTDLVAMRQKQLIGRMYDRMRYNIWQLLGTGTLNIPLNGPAGAIYQDTYSIQTYVAPIPWSSSTTATPILNAQVLQQLQVGHSTDFGAKASWYMNQITANQLINNGNAADFGGRRNQFGATLNNLPDMANYFGAQNLPKPVVFDDGYQPYPVQGPETNPPAQFVKFIPNGLSILIGPRTNGDPVGHFKKTLQAMQPGGGISSGDYNFVKDYAQGINAPLEVPPRIEVHYGYNGGPVLEFPSSVIAATLG
jgi:hypothetical protein